MECETHGDFDSSDLQVIGNGFETHVDYVPEYEIGIVICNHQLGVSDVGVDEGKWIYGDDNLESWTKNRRLNAHHVETSVVAMSYAAYYDDDPKPQRVTALGTCVFPNDFPKGRENCQLYNPWNRNDLRVSLKRSETHLYECSISRRR